MDGNKRLSNLADHKLDFRDAWRVYKANDKVTYKSRFPYEDRWIDLAEVKNLILVLVYTLRAGADRWISFRPAKRAMATPRSVYPCLSVV